MDFNKLSRSFKVSFAFGLILSSLGFLFLVKGYDSLGFALFFFLPLAIGVTSGVLPEPKQAAYGTLVSLGLFSIVLLFTKAEGIVCVLMALPILLGAIALGWFVGNAIRKSQKDGGKNAMKASFVPLFLFVAASFFDVFSANEKVPGTVSRSLIVEASPQEVYQAIIAVDTVDAELSLLHHLGLPTPLKCVLTEEKVGGQRLCHFKEGLIVETIKELKKDRLLRMDVSSAKLDRERDWLEFDEDLYTIESLEDGKTQITRTTTYSSNLAPRAYWELMESMTIRAQQDLVFRNLKKDLVK